MRNRCVAVPLWVVPPSDWFDVWPGFACFVAGVDARHVVLLGLNGPFRLGDSLSSWVSWIPRGYSLPCGWDVLARQLLRWPIWLTFASVRAPLQQRILHFCGSTSAPSLIRGSVSGINKDLLKVHLTHFILYNSMLTLFTYISRDMEERR